MENIYDNNVQQNNFQHRFNQIANEVLQQSIIQKQQDLISKNQNDNYLVNNYGQIPDQVKQQMQDTIQKNINQANISPQFNQSYLHQNNNQKQIKLVIDPYSIQQSYLQQPQIQSIQGNQQGIIVNKDGNQYYKFSVKLGEKDYQKLNQNDKGSFPLDHFSECDEFATKYNQCVVKHQLMPKRCRQTQMEYLDCRMKAGLMEKEEFEKLGFTEEGSWESEQAEQKYLFQNIQERKQRAWGNVMDQARYRKEMQEKDIDPMRPKGL
ncbi:hypothetical protein PPERSA_05014 [Pseudocohnilembus persalinus]|uniref:CHCH domain-containing protein n=1 Tax=Pseudocohnilembus persalinus TaxID=266149 RepID=A0A0V0QW47_PSEPJ|nr:hypothetical protein PPERSA_05014 [Pseudocohnilembus persalinus]|eukprot:KRX06401.1 hypothetical protein PPERSA_05014 [Pseudocohnilembus persalinus]